MPTELVFAIVVGLMAFATRWFLNAGTQSGSDFRLGVAADPTTRQLQIRLDSVLHRLKGELGMTETRHDNRSMAAAGGTLDGLFTKVEFGSRADAHGTWLLTLRVEVAGGLPPTLSVGPEARRSAVTQRLTGLDFQLGDPDADDALRLYGDDADLAAILSRPVVSELRHLVHANGSVDRGRLRATLHPNADRGFDIAEIVRWIRLARSLALRPGERPARLAEHLSPAFPAVFRLAAAEALVEHHLNRPEVEAAVSTLEALLDEPSLDAAHRARAARSRVQFRAARGLLGDAGGLAVVEGAEGGEVALAAEGRVALTEG